MKKPSPFPSARIEAQRLAVQVGRKGTSAEAVRELIDISPRIETQLRRDAERFRSAGSPAEGQRILAMIAWRKQVLGEFDALFPRTPNQEAEREGVGPAAGAFAPQA